VVELAKACVLHDAGGDARAVAALAYDVCRARRVELVQLSFERAERQVYRASRMPDGMLAHAAHIDELDVTGRSLKRFVYRYLLDRFLLAGILPDQEKPRHGL